MQCNVFWNPLFRFLNDKGDNTALRATQLEENIHRERLYSMQPMNILCIDQK